ncbi:MAG: hypothetical protein ACF8TS_00720 [Maioricimonas sp. JB049]
MKRQSTYAIDVAAIDRWENEGGFCVDTAEVSTPRTTTPRMSPPQASPVEASPFEMSPARMSPDPQPAMQEKTYAQLHRVLVGMSSGLLQYASQARLWSPMEARHLRSLLNRLAACQRESIRQLGEFLYERHYPIHWGVFPPEYGRFNYLAIEYLWPKFVASQTRVVGVLEAVRGELEYDEEAMDMLDEILQTELEILTTLEDTESDRPGVSRRPDVSRRPAVGHRSAVARRSVASRRQRRAELLGPVS